MRQCKFILAIMACVYFNSVSADVSQRQDVLAWLNAQDDLGFSQAQVKNFLSQVSIQPKVLPVYGDSAERKYVWSDYRKRLLTNDRIQAGVCFAQKHKALLANTSEQYGVDSHILTAIMGVETNYGNYLGKYPVLETLVTLAFEHPKRTQRFQRELQFFLQVSYQNNLQPLNIMGSPAGAFGFAQFMPFSHFHYAVDGDDDQLIQLTVNIADNLASVANYLLEHRWQTGDPLIAQVKGQPIMEQVTHRAKSGGKPLSHWQASGLKIPTQWQPFMAEKENAGKEFRVYSFSTHDESEYLLAGANFYAITRYNHSLWYARVVVELAQAIASGRGQCRQ